MNENDVWLIGEGGNDSFHTRRVYKYSFQGITPTPISNGYGNPWCAIKSKFSFGFCSGTGSTQEICLRE
jgi:hypothetical protein